MKISREADVRSAVSGLRRIVRALRVSSRAAEKELGVSGAQLFVLHELQSRPGAALKELAARTLTDQSSVSVVVGRLVARGLVTRRVARQDARRAELYLTHAGTSLLRDGPLPVQARLIAAVRALKVSDVRGLARALEALAGGLDADDDAPMFFEEDAPARAPKRRARA